MANSESKGCTPPLFQKLLVIINTFCSQKQMHVNDDELVYRSIRLDSKNFKLDTNGKVRVSANAFADRMQQPSFYRHKLTSDPPNSNPPRMSETDAVIGLIAGNIRQESFDFISGQGKSKTETKYIIDIQPDLSEGQHKSHAIVFATPEFKTKGAFDRLKERLALLANESDWAIAPSETFIKEKLTPK